MRNGLVCLSLVVALTGCSHVAVIDTDPSGAEVRVNGEKIGTSPVMFRETTGWEKAYDVEAYKPGYKKTRRMLHQTEWNMPIVAASVGGFLFFCWPAIGGLLFARQLPDRVVIPLEREGRGQVADPSSPRVSSLQTSEDADALAY